MGSVAEPKRTIRCPSCRNKAIGGPKLEILGDFVPVCAACISRIRAGAGWGYQLPTKNDSPLPVSDGKESAEERFDAVFKASRVLLEEGAREDRIIPTLALAHLLGGGVPRLAAQKEQLVRLRGDEQAWNIEADRFARRYSGLRPVRVVDRVLILERRRVLVTINYAPIAKTPEGVTISVFPHRTPVANAKEVASLYERTLLDAGIAHDERCSVRLGSTLYNKRLEIWIEPGAIVERTMVTEGFTVPQPGWRLDKKASFPHSRLVGDLCAALVAAASAEGFDADIPTRRRSHPPEPENLVPACVAFLLKSYGVDHQEIYRLLDERVLDETWKSDLPSWERDSFRRAATGTLKNQVSRLAHHDANVCHPLTDAAWTLFWEGYEEKYRCTQTLFQYESCFLPLTLSVAAFACGQC